MTQQQIEKAAREIAELEGYSSMHYKYDELRTDCYIAALKMAKWLLSHQWISVEERLPEKNKMVFVRQKTEVGIIYDVDYIDYEGKWFSNFNRASMNSRIPTHWMPIPPLKGGEE